MNEKIRVLNEQTRILTELLWELRFKKYKDFSEEAFVSAFLCTGISRAQCNGVPGDKIRIWIDAMIRDEPCDCLIFGQVAGVTPQVPAMKVTGHGVELVDWALNLWRDVDAPIAWRWKAFKWLANRVTAEGLERIDGVFREAHARSKQ